MKQFTIKESKPRNGKMLINCESLFLKAGPALVIRGKQEKLREGITGTLGQEDLSLPLTSCDLRLLTSLSLFPSLQKAAGRSGGIKVLLIYPPYGGQNK